MLFAVGIVVLGRAPGAWACSCAPPGTTQQEFDSSRLVFAGTATSMHDPKAGEPIQSSGDQIEWTFDVDSVQKGDVADPQTITTARSGATCGYSFEVGKRYQVFTSNSGDGKTAYLCSGTHVLAAGEDPLELRLAGTGSGFEATALALGLAMVVAGAFLRLAPVGSPR